MNADVKKVIEVLEALGWQVVGFEEKTVSVSSMHEHASYPAVEIPAHFEGRRVESFGLTLSRKASA